MPLSEFDPPERFVAGTVGPPGQRTFFLQARSGSRLMTVSIEKMHVSILADRIGELLDTVSVVEDTPEETGPDDSDTDPLETPIEDDFRVNTVSLGWDESRGVLVIECHDRDPDEEAEAEDEAHEDLLAGEVQSLRVVIAPDTARAFATRCQALVAAGRPSCPFCGGPIDPDGHICPRANGYRR
jgi:uncharacterized repeat protein (TIGR03847 family)